MYKDPIVEEIHRIRENISHECNNDMRQIFEYLRKKESERVSQALHPEKKAEDKTKA